MWGIGTRGAVVAGICIGFSLVVLSALYTKREIWVDYDSGMVRECVLWGKYVIRECNRQTAFGDLVAFDGRRGLTGHKKWRLALRFTPAWSKYSPQYEGSRVVADTAMIGSQFPEMGQVKAVELKHTYLALLESNGVGYASDWVSQVVSQSALNGATHHD